MRSELFYAMISISITAISVLLCALLITSMEILSTLKDLKHIMKEWYESLED